MGQRGRRRYDRGMSAGAQIGLGIVVILVGIAVLIGTLVIEIDGGPSWVHYISWAGGGVFGGGVAILANGIRARKAVALPRH